MKIEYYVRKDGKHAWRLRADNGKIIATDGGQGYERKAEAVRMARRVAGAMHSAPEIDV